MNVELAQTDELMDELMKRFDNAVFHGTKRRPIDAADKGCNVFCIRTMGDPHTCIGLSYSLMSYNQAQLDADIEELPPGSL